MGRVEFSLTRRKTGWDLKECRRSCRAMKGNGAKTGFLTHEGLFILDKNNRPIKDFPGAPLALSNKASAHLLEDLRRTFDITISE